MLDSVSGDLAVSGLRNRAAEGVFDRLIQPGAVKDPCFGYGKPRCGKTQKGEILLTTGDQRNRVKQSRGKIGDKCLVKPLRVPHLVRNHPERGRGPNPLVLTSMNLPRPSV